MARNSDKSRKFTPADLAACTGKDGRPVCIAFQGKVYDVSGSALWQGGRHMGLHDSGADLTIEFADAPHGEEVFARYPQVGVIKEEEAPETPEARQSAAREFWRRQVQRVPFIRRHPHPMVVHFPIVFMISTTGFTLLYLFTGVKSFEVTGFHCLGGGVLFTPVAMVTGWFTWWLNYESRPLKPVVIKLILSPILLLAGAGAWVWRFLNPEILAQLRDWPSLGYLALICALTPLVALIGGYGAVLTFPLHHK
ncbi:MAG: DUF2231 domain-containing protein [Thermodesulfobacteriota bacterium]